MAGYADPTHEAGKLIQRITKETLRATEAWTDGRHAEDDKYAELDYMYAELDYELAVELASATEVAASSKVLKVTQVEPSHGFVAWQSLVDGYAPLVALARWRETVQTKTVQDTRARRDQTTEGASQRRENHVKLEMSNRAPLNSTFREGSWVKRRHKNTQLLSPRKRHWTDTVRK